MSNTSNQQAIDSDGMETLRLRGVSAATVERFKYSMIATTILMLMAHLFAFVNLEYSHDSVLYYAKYNILNPLRADGMICEGRFFQPILAWLIYGRTESPWLTGAITIIAISLATFIVSELFDFYRWQVLCAAFILSCNLSLIAIIGSFGTDAAMYSISMMLSFLAVYVYEKVKKPWNIICFVLFSIAAMGIYQAHIGILAGMMVLILFQNIVSTGKPWKQFFIDGFKRVFWLGFISAGYLVAMKLSLMITGIAASTRYNGPARLHDLTIGIVLNAILRIYKRVIGYYTRTPYVNVSLDGTIYLSKDTLW